jgi:hypothetical protein
MARRRRRRFHFEELEELLERPDPTAEAAHAEAEKTAPDGEKAGLDTPQSRVLELQKTAGNRAVGAVLDRVAAAVPRWPKQKQLILDGLVLPLEAFTGGLPGPAGTPGGGTAKPRADEFTGPGELDVTLPVGEWSPELFNRYNRGDAVFKTVELVIPTKDGKGIRIILTGVVIVELASSGGGAHPLERLTLTFQARTFTQNPPPS